MLLILVIVLAGALIAGSIGLLVWSLIVGVQRRVRDTAGICVCRYDLTGLPTDARCPECGCMRLGRARRDPQGVRLLAVEGLIALVAVTAAVGMARFVVVHNAVSVPVLIASVCILGFPGVVVRVDLWFRRREVALTTSISGQAAIVGLHIGVWYLFSREADGRLPNGTLVIAGLSAITMLYGGMAVYLIWSELTRR